MFKFMWQRTVLDGLVRCGLSATNGLPQRIGRFERRVKFGRAVYIQIIPFREKSIEDFLKWRNVKLLLGSTNFSLLVCHSQATYFN